MSEAQKELTGNYRELNSLETNTMEAIEQGIWTAISYYSEIDKSSAIKVAKELKPSTGTIHEFDWERFIDVFGSKRGLHILYQQDYPTTKSLVSATTMTDAFS